MQTLGFTCGISGEVTLDQSFSETVTNPAYIVVSTYIYIPTTGTAGGIVYVNTAGQTMWWPHTTFGANPIAATKILTSATVNGVSRTTTATPMGWAGSISL